MFGVREFSIVNSREQSGVFVRITEITLRLGFHLSLDILEFYRTATGKYKTVTKRCRFFLRIVDKYVLTIRTLNVGYLVWKNIWGIIVVVLHRIHYLGLWLELKTQCYLAHC